MSHLPIDRARTASPGIKQVAFESKCQIIPQGDCAELRNLLSLCPTRAQSPPIAGHSRSSSLIARAISPQLGRAKSLNLKKPSALGHAPSNTSTSWRTRLASWGSNTASASSSAGHRRTQSHTIDTNVTAAFAFPPQSSSSHGKDASSSSTGTSNTLSNNDGPRLVAPVAARGTPNLIIPSNDDDALDISPSNESIISFDDVDAEFQHAVSRVAMPPFHVPFASIQPTSSPPTLDPCVRRSISELQHRQPISNSRPKSCLVRSRTPQAPGPPRSMGDGMTPLRATRSHDRVGCFAPRRRADGVPVVCASSPLESPLESPQEEQGPIAWVQNAEASQSAQSLKQAAAPPAPDKSKLSRWRRFRRGASEGSQRYEPSSPVGPPSEMRLNDANIKRQIQAGRWPFEVPLNVECSCKNCQAKIEVGLASDYEPRWTRAARIRWLEAQEDAALQSAHRNSSSASTGSTVPRSASRTAIQADEVAQLHNETVHPMTADELAQEPTSPQVERGEPLACAARSPNPTGLEEGDDALRREIVARRQKVARQSPVMRHGARSMLRQIEEAERREQEAERVRSASRQRDCESGAGSRPGSAVSSPTSPAFSAAAGMSPWSRPQERQVASPSPSPTSSYFEFTREPPERVRSPLIPADVAVQPRYARSNTKEDTDSMTISMASVAQTLEAIASPEASPISE